MTRSSLILLLLFGICIEALSDAGNCAKYEVALQLEGGKKVQGYVFIIKYQLKFHFQDNSFLEYLKSKTSDTLYLVKNIQLLKFPVPEDGNIQCELRLNAAPSEDVIKVPKMAIKKAELISYSVCNNCDKADEKDGYYWNGIYPTVIIELTKTEIDLLQTSTPIATLSFSDDYEYAPIYWMISYSKDYARDDLGKLQDDFLKETKELIRSNRWKMVPNTYATLKSQLRKNKVILFQIGYAP